MSLVRSIRGLGLPLLTSPFTFAQRFSSSSPLNAVEKYSKATSVLHWAMAGGILTCFGTVQASMNSKDNKFKGEMMTIHKSFGLMIAGLVPARIAVALLSRRPGPLLGTNVLEQWAAHASHFALYFFLIAMPGSGIAMGYYGGKGLPFFSYTIPGAATPNGEIAKNAFKFHKSYGPYFEYLVPIHMGAAFLHAAKGQKIFSRINPFV